MTIPQQHNFTHNGFDVEVKTEFAFIVRKDGETVECDTGFDTLEACVEAAKASINDTHETEQEIAYAFVRLLRDALSLAEFAEMQKRNAAEPDLNICHSHDFLDANVVMADAYKNHTGEEIDLQSDEDIAIWNMAWKLAAPVIRVVPT